MEGINRIYQTGIRHAKHQYVPNRASPVLSIISILLYTIFVLVLTEWIMRGTLTRWLYLGSVVMVVSMVYSGTITLELSPS